MIKYCLLVSVMVFSLGTHALDFDYDDRDKQAHIAATAVISGVTYISFRSNNVDRLTSAVGAMMITMAFAFLKERYVDEDYSVEDMQANLVGSTAGVIIPMVFTF